MLQIFTNENHNHCEIQDSYLHKLLEDVTDLHVGLPNLHVKKVVAILINHIGIWPTGGLSVHIRLELNFKLAGICNNREQ